MTELPANVHPRLRETLEKQPGYKFWRAVDMAKLLAPQVIVPCMFCEDPCPSSGSSSVMEDSRHLEAQCDWCYEVSTRLRSFVFRGKMKAEEFVRKILDDVENERVAQLRKIGNV